MAKREKAADAARKTWPGAEVWPLERIKPYPNNPRTHPPAQIDLLSRLLKKHGPDQPIVVDEDGVILKGHGRRLAAINAEMKTFPVFVREGLSEEEKIALRIGDNQVALLSGWDSGLLKLEIQQLQTADYQIDLLGFGDAQLVTFLSGAQAPAEFGVHDERTMQTEFRCPRCSYMWSGNPNPLGHTGPHEDDSVQMRVPKGDSGGGQPRKTAKSRPRTRVQK